MFPKPKILVVEDDIQTLEALGANLKEQNYDPELAQSGQAGLKKIEEAQYDVVLLDIKLPDMNGLDFLKKIREKSHHTMAIIVTGYSNEKNAVLALNLGAYAYLRKPVSMPILFTYIHDALEVQALRTKIADHLKDLQLSNEQLEQLDKIRVGFIALVAHEFKSPLSTIKFCLETLNDSQIVQEQKSHLVTTVERNVDRLSHMVSDLLSMTALEKGKAHLHFEKLSLSSLMEDVVRLVEFKLKKKEIKFVNQMSKKMDLRVYADKERTTDILLNIIGNAIKFTPKGGQITMQATGVKVGEKYFVQVRILDTGCGIAKEDLQNVFDAFKQAGSKNLNDNGEKGSGLGLYLVKEYVGAQGGKIWIESTVGQGTSVTFTLPT